MNELLKNIGFLHTTPMGASRIRRNLALNGQGEQETVDWCRRIIEAPDTVLSRMGKNWYAENADCRITVNATSYTIITAHRKRAR